MLVLELVHFQLHQHVAPQEAVVKDQVHEKILVPDEQAFLAGLQTESIPQFQHKLLQVLEQGRLQAVLRQHILRLQPQELKGEGALHHVAGRELHRFRLHVVRELPQVLRQPHPLEVQRADLPPQLPHGPIAFDALNLIERPFQGILNGQQFRQVGKRKLGDDLTNGNACQVSCARQLQLGRHCLPNLGDGFQDLGCDSPDLRVSLVELSVEF